MNEELKKEVLEQLELEIRFGFADKEEIFESIREMVYEEPNVDDRWLRHIIAEKYKQHQKESQDWPAQRDFNRLANAFDELTKEKIVCLHKAGYTKQDAEGDCIDTISQLKEKGVAAIGFCYYHEQDLARAVDPEAKSLFLGFDSFPQDDKGALSIAKAIIAKLIKYGLDADWSGSVDHRIEIRNIDWKKVPDDQEWGPLRVISLSSASVENKKPFWKFW